MANREDPVDCTARDRYASTLAQFLNHEITGGEYLLTTGEILRCTTDLAVHLA